MKLLRYLSALGYGTRRELERTFAEGSVATAEGSPLRGTETVGATGLRHQDLRVHSQPLDPPPGAVVLLHKPAGYVCSTEDRNPLVYDLLPPRFRERSPIVSPVGRLDRDTTGLLLLTDDGPLLHRITSPRSHVPRTYRAVLAETLIANAEATFASGTMRLAGEVKPLAPAQLERLDDRTVRLTIAEGRYHQVRRMFAALGNHVQHLHRESLGPLQLGDVAEGTWRLLTAEERRGLEQALTAARAGGAARPPAP